MSIKEMVGQGKLVNFIHYQNNELWYVTECGFEFPVPTIDTNEAIFLHQDKAILYMKWIRKHLENIKIAKEEQEKLLSVPVN